METSSRRQDLVVKLRLKFNLLKPFSRDDEGTNGLHMTPFTSDICHKSQAYFAYLAYCFSQDQRPKFLLYLVRIPKVSIATKAKLFLDAYLPWRVLMKSVY